MGIFMTKFERIGVNYQNEAESKKQAQKSFAYSCNCCCAKGMHIDCDKCAIAQAHYLTIACFDSFEK